MADPEKTPQGLRHLYTKANHGSLGSRGFQTVACARKLEKGRILLENLVREYRPAVRGESSPTRQIFSVPDPKYALLTTFWPRPAHPKERRVNFWAESVLVPLAWLEAAAWDVDAAFEDLSQVFEGPEAADLYQSWPCDLDPVALAPLRPGSLDRLDLVREHLDDTTLFDLVRALVSQREARQPIFVVGRADAPASERERLVFLLPLLLPPPLRARIREQKLLPLRLRDYGHVEHLPVADLQGVPAGVVPDRGIVVDLRGDGPHLDAPRDPRAEGYAEWVCATIRRSGWRESFQKLYDEAARHPEKDPIAGMKPTRRGGLTVDEEEKAMKKTRAKGSEGEDDANDAYGARTAEWETRHATEQVVRTAERRFEKDKLQQLAILERGLEKIIERFSKQMAEQQKELLAKLERQSAEVLRAGAQAARRPNPVARAEPRDVDRGMVRPSARKPGWRYAVVLGLGLALGFFAARLPKLLKPEATPPAVVGEETGNRSGDEVEPGELLEALRDGQTASAVLARILDEGGVAKDWAAAAGLALRLGKSASVLTDDLSCALVQTLLGVTVDGDCGARTKSTLENTSCAGEPWPDSGLCLLHGELKLPVVVADCEALWPLHRPCGWDLPSAMSLLDLIRAAERKTGNAELKANLAAYDLARNPAALRDVAATSLEEKDAALILAAACVAALDAKKPKGVAEMTAEDRARVRDRFAPELAGSGGS